MVIKHLVVLYVGAEVPLQRTRMQIPFDADIGAIQFVLRSDDKTRWWKDGSGNFLVPIPGDLHHSLDICCQLS